MFNKELYIPENAVIEEIRNLTSDTKLFRLRLKRNGEYQPGQFVQVSVLGAGEVPLSIASSPTRRETLELCIRNVGSVTQRIHQLKKGEGLGIRGPYGNPFPLEESHGKNLLFVAGGIGLAPLRSMIHYALDRRKDFGKIVVLYGARASGEMIFKEEVHRWEKEEDTQVYVTIDNRETGWKGNVGVVTTLFKYLKNMDVFNAFVCGPPVMIPFVVTGLLKLGLKEERLFLALERYMKCGVGKCGHCYLGTKYVCTDGPVFRYSEIKESV